MNRVGVGNALLLIGLVAAAFVHADVPGFARPNPKQPRVVSPDNAVPFQVEIRDDIKEPHLIISRFHLNKAKALAAAQERSNSSVAQTGDPHIPIGWVGLMLGLITGCLCLAVGRKGWAVSAFLLAVAIPLIAVPVNAQPPGASLPPQWIALQVCDVVVEDDSDGLWFRLEIPRAMQSELKRALASPAAAATLR
jgi:hypothetical protein